MFGEVGSRVVAGVGVVVDEIWEVWVGGREAGLGTW